MRSADGQAHRGSFPAVVEAQGLGPLSLRSAEYPVCALHRDTTTPATVLQVGLDGSGLTADCAVVVGDAPLPDFDAS